MTDPDSLPDYFEPSEFHWDEDVQRGLELLRQFNEASHADFSTQ